jgi:hypothetical protein
MTKLKAFIQQLSERTELSESSYGTFAKITRLELKMVVEMLKVAKATLSNISNSNRNVICGEAKMALEELNRLAEGVVDAG